MNEAEYLQSIAGMFSGGLVNTSQEVKKIVSEAISHKEETAVLPDGYNGHTVRLYTEPLEINGDSIKLACAEDGREHMIRWARKSDVEKALKEQQCNSN